MTSSNIVHIPLAHSEVDVFTFGESSFYAYNSNKPCLIVYRLDKLDRSLGYSTVNLDVPSPSSSRIRRLILNGDETILALVSDHTAYLVFLPPTINSSDKGSFRSPVYVLPSSTAGCVLDFLWLTSRHFVVAHSDPLSSECHLYTVRPGQKKVIEHRQRLGDSSSSSVKMRGSSTPTKRISLNQSMKIVKIDLAKRKTEQATHLLLFALKENGDFFLVDIDEHELLYDDQSIRCEFVGPLRISPMKRNNYGYNYRHSNLLCLSCSLNPVILFTSTPSQLTQCLLVNTSPGDYQLFAMETLLLPPRTSTDNLLTIHSLRRNPLEPNVYYLVDSSFNVYSADIPWLDETEPNEIGSSRTEVQHLFQSPRLIEQFGVIQTKGKGQYLAILTESSTNSRKELILFRPTFTSSTISTLTPQPRSLIVSRPMKSTDVPSEFVLHIRSLLTDDHSSTARPSLPSLEERLEKQERVRKELDNRQRHLTDQEAVQSMATNELMRKWQTIIERFSRIIQQYEHERSRRVALCSTLDDDVRMIERQTSSLSPPEIVVQQQLKRDQIQINLIETKIRLLEQFLRKQPTAHRIDQSSLGRMQEFTDYYRNKIEEMKQHMCTIDPPH